MIAIGLRAAFTSVNFSPSNLNSASPCAAQPHTAPVLSRNRFFGTPPASFSSLMSRTFVARNVATQLPADEDTSARFSPSGSTVAVSSVGSSWSS